MTPWQSLSIRHVILQLQLCTCSVCDSLRSRVARAFQALKGLLERGHGSCLYPCSVHTAVWADSGGSGCLIPCLSPTPPGPHVPAGLTQTKTCPKRPESDWHPSYGRVPPGARARSADSANPVIRPPDKTEQKGKHARTMHNRSTGRKTALITRGLTSTGRINAKGQFKHYQANANKWFIFFYSLFTEDL